MCRRFVQNQLLKTMSITAMDDYIRESTSVGSQLSYDTKKLELIHYARIIPQEVIQFQFICLVVVDKSENPAFYIVSISRETEIQEIWSTLLQNLASLKQTKD